VQTNRGAHLTFALSAELTVAIAQLSQQQGVTLFMTLLAAFDTLLYRYIGVVARKHKRSGLQTRKLLAHIICKQKSTSAQINCN
jgi:hypothetical protein